jgi:hypothetical protein
MKFLAMIFDGVIGFYIFAHNNVKDLVLKVSTSFIGSFMFVYGIHFTIDRGVVSNLAMQKGFYMDNRTWLLLLAFIIVGVLGTCI